MLAHYWIVETCVGARRVAENVTSRVWYGRLGLAALLCVRIARGTMGDFALTRHVPPSEIVNSTSVVAQATTFMFFQLGNKMEEAAFLQEFSWLVFVVAIAGLLLLAISLIALLRNRIFSNKKVRKHGRSLLVQLVVGIMCGHAYLLFASSVYLGLMAGPVVCSSAVSLLLVHFSLLAGPASAQLYVMWWKLRADRPLVTEQYQRIMWTRPAKNISFLHGLVCSALAVALIALGAVRGERQPGVTFARTYCDEIHSNDIELSLTAVLWIFTALPLLFSFYFACRVAPSRFLPLWGKRWTKLRHQWIALNVALTWTFLTIFIDSSAVRLFARFISIAALTVTSTWPLLADVVAKLRQRGRYGKLPRDGDRIARHETFLDNQIESLEEQLEKYQRRRLELDRQKADNRARMALELQPRLSTSRVDIICMGAERDGTTAGKVVARHAHVELRHDGQVAVFKRAPSTTRRAHQGIIRSLTQSLFMGMSADSNAPLCLLELLKSPDPSAGDERSSSLIDVEAGEASAGAAASAAASAASAASASPLAPSSQRVLSLFCRDVRQDDPLRSSEPAWFVLTFNDTKGNGGDLLATMWRRELRDQWRRSGSRSKQRRASLGSALVSAAFGTQGDGGRPARLKKSMSSPPSIEAARELELASVNPPTHAEAPRTLQLFVGSWNVGGVRKPTDEMEVTTRDLRKWMRLPPPVETPGEGAATAVDAQHPAAGLAGSAPSPHASASVSPDAQPDAAGRHWCDVYVITFQELNTTPAKVAGAKGGGAGDERSVARSLRKRLANRASSSASAVCRGVGGAHDASEQSQPCEGSELQRAKTMGDRLQAALGPRYEQLNVGEGSDGHGMSAKTVGGINKNRNLRIYVFLRRSSDGAHHLFDEVRFTGVGKKGTTRINRFGEGAGEALRYAFGATGGVNEFSGGVSIALTIGGTSF